MHDSLEYLKHEVDLIFKEYGFLGGIVVLLTYLVFFFGAVATAFYAIVYFAGLIVKAMN
jgi:cell division protein FtsW (lipid II flippase)